MKGRKRSFVFIVGHGAIFIGIIGLNGCIQTEVQPQNLHLRISHLGGEPFAYRWVLPVQSENNTTGWWSQPSWTSTGDTVWTDEFGRATLLSFTSNTRGLVCQPFDGKDAPYYINFGFYPTTSCADHDLSFRKRFGFNSLAIEMVIASGSQLSFGPNSLRLTWIRGTRSHPVAPPCQRSVYKTGFIHLKTPRSVDFTCTLQKGYCLKRCYRQSPSLFSATP